MSDRARHTQDKAIYALAMARGFDANRFKRELRAAERKAEAAWRREVDRADRENKRGLDAYNRKLEQHNKKVVTEIDRYNRGVERYNKAVIDNLNRQLRAASSGGVRYTPTEQALADRVQGAVAPRDEREWDTFLSYARIDGSHIADELRGNLEGLGVRVWFDAIAIAPGKSQAMQMDKGLQKARAGIALLTPACLAGRFWTERELGALLHKETLIPVLHGVTFDDVAECTGILPDLAGFEKRRRVPWSPSRRRSQPQF